MSCGGPNGIPAGHPSGMGGGMAQPPPIQYSGQFHDHDTSQRPSHPIRPIENTIVYATHDPIPPPPVVPEMRPIKIPSPEPSMFIPRRTYDAIAKNGRIGDNEP